MGAPKGKRPTSKEMLSIRLPKVIDGKLRQVAEEYGISITEVVKRCLTTNSTIDNLFN